MKQRQTNNGSIRKREVTQPQQHTEYYLFNSQGNLKAYSDDIMSFAYYGYNAANTRTYKLSLYNTNIWINGQQEPLNMQLQQAMFYPNTYLNFNGNGEYTKQYYNGTERIASRLGDNTTTIALNNNILEDRKLSLEEHFREDIHKLIYETVPIDMPPFIDVNTLQATGTPNDIYYYHPNHLGNTAFVTDNNATITQGFLYAPFGEITTEYNINFGNNVIPKYSFNAKELDEETGMYYYEARYYAPPTFTSRDPLFEKYFWMSPYAYCANNPVMYVDPSGKDWFEPEGGGEAIWVKGSSKEITQNGIKYNNVGQYYTKVNGNVLTHYNQNNIVGRTDLDSDRGKKFSMIAAEGGWKKDENKKTVRESQYGLYIIGASMENRLKNPKFFKNDGTFESLFDPNQYNAAKSSTYKNLTSKIDQWKKWYGTQSVMEYLNAVYNAAYGNCVDILTKEYGFSKANMILGYAHVNKNLFGSHTIDIDFNKNNTLIKVVQSSDYVFPKKQ